MKKAILMKASADPAADAEISWTADEDVIIHGLSFTLVTDGTGTPGPVHVVVDDGTTVYLDSPADSTQAISSTVKYVAYDGSVKTALGDGVRILAWPQGGLYLPKGHRIR